MKKISSCAFVFIVLSFIIISPFNASAAQYDFSSLGTASGGFKPQGNRFLVSEEFTQDGTGMYYDDGTNETVTGMVVKADGTNLASFDLEDIQISPFDGTYTVSITITADLSAGGTESQSVSSYYLGNSGQAYSLVDMGMDFSAFNDVTELRIDLTVHASVVWWIDFNTITINDEQAPASPGTTPTTQASGLTTASTASDAINIYWQNGDGSKRIVFVKQGNSGTPTVADGIEYQADSNFSTATDIGDGWRCVFKGSDHVTAISGLTADTEYRLVVYEFDGSGGGEAYLTSTGTNIANQSTDAPGLDKKDFSSLGTASGGFKAQGGRYLVSDSFTNDSTSMYYNSSDATVTGMVIKPNGTSLLSFDLVDMEFRPFDTDRVVSITVTADLKAGGTTSQGVTGFTMYAGIPYSLALMGMDFSAFNDVTELRFDITTDSVYNINFDNITIDDPDEYVVGITPSTQATNLKAASNGITDMAIYWQNGDGSKRIVFVKEGDSGTPTVVDGTVYSNDSDFSAATDIGDGWKCVQKGTEHYMTISGLTANTQYRIVVFEFDGSGGGETYLTSIGTNIINHSTSPDTIEKYDFSGLGAASGGFKPQGGRFLVSDTFAQDTTKIYYNSTDETVSNITIKPDGTNLVAFDLVDMQFSPYGADREVSLTVTADLSAGGTTSQSIANFTMINGLPYSLGLLGLDFSLFDDVTELRFDVTVTGNSAQNLNFENITLADQQGLGTPPTLTTQAVTAITATAATGNGNITDLGDPAPTAHGVVWNTTGTPTTADNATDHGAAASTGAFTSSITGLAPNTTYYVRAYATNTTGTAYGAEVSFTTDPQAPTVTTQAVTDITATAATGNGNVIDLGDPAPTAHGVVWNTTGTPTTADSATNEGTASTTGAFTSSITGLAPNTTYYVRAYATNTAGTAYGAEVSFTTDPQAPTVTTQAVTAITATSATGNGNVIDLGIPAPSAHGVVWNTAGTPTTADSATNEGAAASTGAFTSSITGLAPNTTYYVRAYATNTAGTAYGAEVSFSTDSQAPPTVTTQAVTAITATSGTGNGNVTDLGVPAPTAHGIAWNTTGTPTTADSATNEGAAASTGAFTSSITGLAPNTTYYVRAYATNTTGTVYGAEVSFTTDPQAPTVTTQAVTAITATSATGNGNVTDLGVPAPSAHGVVWNTTGTPTTADSATDEGAAATIGAFTSSITGLASNTTYYVRAYATNTAGTVYGAEVSFITNPQPPTVTTLAVTAITGTSATGNGNITDLGDPAPTAHGVVWNTTGAPTTADNATDERVASTAGAFTSAITGLAPNTTYYIRAYATNTAGTVYGDEVSFTTSWGKAGGGGGGSGCFLATMSP